MKKLNLTVILVETNIPRGSVIRIVTDNDDVITRSAGKRTPVSHTVLNIADDSSLGNRSKGQNITNSQSSLLSTVQELTSVHTLSGNKELLLMLVSERMSESHLGQRSSTTRIVDDIRNNTLDVAISFGVIERPESGRSFPSVSVGSENTSRSFPLCSNYTTHRGCSGKFSSISLILSRAPLELQRDCHRRSVHYKDPNPNFHRHPNFLSPPSIQFRHSLRSVFLENIPFPIQPAFYKCYSVEGYTPSDNN
ncbi:hypothetical protein Mapa_011848 [Marchantia paleacea]|nr:hypothetical protein Mapa_011848 [Marchantia paleacea]